MNKVFLNILMNACLSAVFVFLNNWALTNQLEETFIFLAVAFSLTVLLSNALFIAYVFRNKIS